MKKAIIFGCDQFAEVLSYFLNDEEEYEVCGYVVDGKYRHEDYFLGKPLIDFEDAQKHFSPQEYGIFICIGYTNMNRVRAEKFKQAHEKGYEILSYRHKTANIFTEDFGEGNIIMDGVTIGPFCKVGNGNVFWPNSHVAHHTKVGDFNFFTISCSVAGNITIGNNSIFGNSCIVNNGVSVADYNLIGAGCFVSKSTDIGGVYVPQKSIKLEGKCSDDFDLSIKNKGDKI